MAGVQNYDHKSSGRPDSGATWNPYVLGGSWQVMYPHVSCRQCLNWFWIYCTDCSPTPDVETNEQNLCNSIFKALTNLDEFQLTLNNSEASFSEGENVVSKPRFKTNHVRQEFFIGRDRPALPVSTTSGQ
ncbi:hypothetical protein TNCV_1308691 [Trichonephila clavipes]|nr:hypothetical protein TNCV_1308691 [Trichonephila clavipes]